MTKAGDATAATREALTALGVRAVQILSDGMEGKSTVDHFQTALAGEVLDRMGLHRRGSPTNAPSE